MKLLEVEIKSRMTKKAGEKTYTKFIITIPNEIIEKLEWKKGMDLEIKYLPSGVFIKKKRKEN